MPAIVGVSTIGGKPIPWSCVWWAGGSIVGDMKALLALSVAAVVLAMGSPTWARLGETEEQCEKRYGKPSVFTDPFPNRPTIPGEAAPAQKVDKQLLYNTPSAEILVGFIDGTAASVQYTFTSTNDQSPRLTGQFINGLLKANAPSASWLYNPDHPYTLDPKADDAPAGKRWQLQGTLFSTDGELYAFFDVSPSIFLIQRTSLRPTFKWDAEVPDLGGL